MSNYKAKAIHTDLSTFRHNQVYPGIIQTYSKPCVTLTYLEPWYIQNSDIFRTWSIFRTVVYSEPPYLRSAGVFKIWSYSEPCQTSAMKHFAEIVNCCHYFRKLQFFSQYKIATFSTSLNKYHEIVTPEVVMVLWWLSCARELGTVNFWYNCWYIRIN